MKNIYLKDVVDKCDGKLIFGNKKTILENFSKDTRTLEVNDVYVGIKGEKIDGNIYYEEALEKGASGCILNSDIKLKEELIEKYEDRFIILVEDTIKCLQDLASYKRSLYDIPVIAITGSTGKTSTKDIVAEVLSQKYNVLKTEGNYNNHIGLPLTILKLKDHDALVVEMGMSHLGEISLLSKIAKPTVGIIINVGTAHIGNLGSRENILKAKLEILDGMSNNGTLVINNDNDLLHSWHLNNKNYNVITFGIDNESDYVAYEITSEIASSIYSVNVNDEKESFEINIPGIHFVYNGLCALSVGKLFNIDNENIKNALKNIELTKRRMEIERIKDITLINDCYNANLDSMKSAINYLGSLSNTRKIAILGDMLELGEFEEQLHRKVGQEIFNNNIDIVITIGNASKHICDELQNLGYDDNRIYHFDSNIEALTIVKKIIASNDTILLKASNGMNFIELFNDIRNILN